MVKYSYDWRLSVDCFRFKIVDRGHIGLCPKILRSGFWAKQKYCEKLFTRIWNFDTFNCLPHCESARFRKIRIQHTKTVRNSCQISLNDKTDPSACKSLMFRNTSGQSMDRTNCVKMGPGSSKLSFTLVFMFISFLTILYFSFSSHSFNCHCMFACSFSNWAQQSVSTWKYRDEVRLLRPRQLKNYKKN
jgi:hypothetical protein